MEKTKVSMKFHENYQFFIWNRPGDYIAQGECSPNLNPVKKKRMKFFSEKNQAMNEEVDSSGHD